MNTLATRSLRAAFLALLSILCACQTKTDVAYSPGSAKRATLPVTVQMPNNMMMMSAGRMWGGMAVSAVTTPALAGLTVAQFSTTSPRDFGHAFEKTFLSAFARECRGVNLTSSPNSGDARFRFSCATYGFHPTAAGLGTMFAGRTRPFAMVEGELVRLSDGAVLWRQTTSTLDDADLPTNGSLSPDRDREKVMAGVQKAALASASILARKFSGTAKIETPKP